MGQGAAAAAHRRGSGPSAARRRALSCACRAGSPRGSRAGTTSCLFRTYETTRVVSTLVRNLGYGVGGGAVHALESKSSRRARYMPRCLRQCFVIFSSATSYQSPSVAPGGGRESRDGRLAVSPSLKPTRMRFPGRSSMAMAEAGGRVVEGGRKENSNDGKESRTRKPQLTKR